MTGTTVEAQNQIPEKLREMILYIAEQSEGDEKFGVTKLNKLLFFADFLAYQWYGSSISGANYEVMPEGPMLKDFYHIQDELILSKDLVIKRNEYIGYLQKKPLALRSANISIFKPEEIDVIVHIINDFRDMNASEISAKSHEFLGWQVVNMREEIPYSTALVSTRDLTIEEWELPSKVKIDERILSDLVPNIAPITA